jgi:hypothetical protein
MIAPASMAAVATRPAPTAAPARDGFMANLVVVVGITLVFGAALFSVNNVLLDMAHDGWNQILLIRGSFAPTLDAQTLYRSSGQSKALARTGPLPDVTDAGRIKGFDTRIIQQADKDHEIVLPTIFFKDLPGQKP